MTGRMATLPEGADALVRGVADRGRALVALSGGVDSSVVAALAYRALGRNALAVTLAGPAVSRGEIERASRVAREVGIEHVLLAVDPLRSPAYRANPSNRCYFCRTVEGRRLREYGDARDVRQYLDGVHVDDLGEDRPGIRALDEAGFLHPLAGVGWGKEQVRATARALRLSNAEQLSDACLASRVAHGEPIDAPLLGRIETAEALLLAEGFRRVRVRVSAGAARIEVGPDEVPRLLATPLGTAMTERIAALGFAPVTVDPRGYARRSP